ncbi:MAG: alcohol dehydrogenase catalytic domain-containing protein, partial [Candidatus Kapaibacterium sp.]
MKKVEYNKYGPPEVLEIKNADKPVPGDNDILIKIHATTVTATECTFRRGEPIVARLFTGLIRPKINTLGEELAGEVESVGKSVKSYQAGDQVFGTAGPEFGANAEYICLPDDAVLMPKPS